MSGILTCGPDFFPGWLSILFSVGLALGIVHHLPCLIHRRGSRWFHAGHAAMALSMIYMYLSMSYDWNWLPATWQMWFFIATTAAIVVWLITRLARRQPVNTLWILLLVQQAAMAYMWYPMMRWNAIAIFVLVSWFAIEAFGWAANLFPDDVRMRDNRAWLPYTIGVGTSPRVTVGAALAERPSPVVPECDCDDDRLIGSGWKDRTIMAIMALSMGYMFYGMQLLR
ncbi:MAG: DUF5134 domain-containing protein [Mycobacterium sp.]